MAKIYDEFHSLVSGRPNSKARGFTNINCPACGDKRRRGGFAPTATGGFRYFCFNGGCTYNIQPTGWEPGNGLTGRVRNLFELLGGNIQRIPFKERFRQNTKITDKNGNVVGHEKKLTVATQFPEVELPIDTDFLADAIDYDERALPVLEYVEKRSPLFLETDYPLLWTPKYPKYLLLPYMHFGEKVVGYMGRHITNTSGKDRFIQRAPRDYLFGQHRLSTESGKYVFVMESPLDSILFRGVATRDNRLTEKQINLLNMSGRTPVLIPDQNSKIEAEPYLKAARENGWYVSIPDWNFKDPGEAIQKNGLLWTIEEVTSAMTKNPKMANFLMAGAQG